MMRLTPTEAVFALLGLVLGGGITACLVWIAGGTSVQVQRDTLIAAVIGGFLGVAIGAKP